MKKDKKIPVQIYLEPEQDKVISHLAKGRGKSRAAVIRACISTYIANLPTDEDPALNIVKIGDSGKRDISEKHDDYLAKSEDA